MSQKQTQNLKKMQEIANDIKKINQKIAQWKEQNASILEEKKGLLEELKEAKERLMTEMEDAGETKFTDDEGTTYTLKSKNKEKHSSKQLKEVFGDEDPKLKKYIANISEETTSVTIRKKRKVNEE